MEGMLLGRTWLGIIIIAIGIGFLLEQSDMISFSSIVSNWWPIILIIIGLLQLFTRSHSAYIIGPIFIIVGLFLLFNEMTDLYLLPYLWPIVIIYIGIIVIFSRTNSTHEKNINKNNVLDSISLFAGSDIKSQSNPFEGGSILTVFGGADIDLRDVVIIDDEITIEITSVFGGVSLKVPEHVHVEISGVPIFGGWEDQTKNNQIENSHQPILYLKCVTIFGGVEVTN